MPLANYPSTIPHIPERGGFVRPQHHEPASSFKPEDGPDIRRVASNTRIKRLNYRLIFTAAEYAIWQTFVEVTLVQGTLHFMMSVPLIGWTCVTRRVYLEGAQWTDEPFGMSFAVQFQLNAFVAA